MTWNSHVATHSPSVNPIGLLACGPSSSHTMIVKIQCQATTTSRLKARMKSTYRSRPASRPAGPVTAAVVVVLATANILTNRVLPEWSYVPLNLAVAALVVGCTRLVVPLDAMGFAHWRRGLRWGGMLFLATLALLLTAAAVPALRDLFADRRVGGGWGRLLSETLVRIPLGTVVVEEVAFRGALPALLARGRSTAAAAAWSSLLFGLWHVLPAWGIDDVNPAVDAFLGDGWAGRLSGVVLAVAATFVAGLWLCFVRSRSGSLLAPILAHVATNSLGFAVAWGAVGA